MYKVTRLSDKARQTKNSSEKTHVASVTPDDFLRESTAGVSVAEHLSAVSQVGWFILGV